MDVGRSMGDAGGVVGDGGTGEVEEGWGRVKAGCSASKRVMIAVRVESRKSRRPVGLV